MQVNKTRRVHICADCCPTCLRFVRAAASAQPCIGRDSNGVNDVCDDCRAGNCDITSYLGNANGTTGHSRRGDIHTTHRDGDCAELLESSSRGERCGVGRTLSGSVSRNRPFALSYRTASGHVLRTLSPSLNAISSTLPSGNTSISLNFTRTGTVFASPRLIYAISSPHTSQAPVTPCAARHMPPDMAAYCCEPHRRPRRLFSPTLQTTFCR